MAWSKSKFLLALFAWLTCSTVFAQEPVKEDVWDKLRRDHTYNEEFVPLPEEGRAIPTPIGLGVWWEMLKLFLLIILVIGLIYLVVRLLGKGKFASAKIAFPETDLIPSAHSPIETIETALERALVAGDYREAVRLRYQLALKVLFSKKLVRPEKDKTNWEYVAEVKADDLSKPFAALTRNHEKVWYAGENIDRSAYELHAAQFDSFFTLSQV